MPSVQFPVILAGQTLTAALLQSMTPLVAIKPSDQSVTNSAAVVNDTALSLTLKANASYLFHLLGATTGPALNTGDFKYTFTWPAGSTTWHVGSGFAVQATVAPVITNATNASGGLNWLGVNGNAGSPVLIEGVIQVGATGGTLQFQWAQFTANATATVLKAGSVLTAWQIG